MKTLSKCLAGLLLYSAMLVSAYSVQTIDRPGFKMQYPDAWTLADYQSDYNPDRYFTIDTEGNSSITIEILDLKKGESADDMLFHALSVLDGPLVDTYSRSDFDDWGVHEGQGKHLKGKVMSMFPGGARIFFMTQGDRGIMITEIYYSADLDTVMEGFQLIGNTFQLK